MRDFILVKGKRKEGYRKFKVIRYFRICIYFKKKNWVFRYLVYCWKKFYSDWEIV